jgi:hypothetical protein
MVPPADVGPDPCLPLKKPTNTALNKKLDSAAVQSDANISNFFTQL